jgi:hypothetical protein
MSSVFKIFNIWACDYLVCFRYTIENILHKGGGDDFDKLMVTTSQTGRLWSGFS